MFILTWWPCRFPSGPASSPALQALSLTQSLRTAHRLGPNKPGCKLLIAVTAKGVAELMTPCSPMTSETRDISTRHSRIPRSQCGSASLEGRDRDSTEDPRSPVEITFGKLKQGDPDQTHSVRQVCLTQPCPLPP